MYAWQESVKEIMSLPDDPLGQRVTTFTWLL